ncbi:MAG: glycosyltransferase [Acidobacteriota bacterium]|nr:glycosyltransferase [Acidobacteriota bacterium]
MKLSIIVPAFNEEKCLPETLEKVKDASVAANCDSEVIVVDNDSTDKTGEIAKLHRATVIFEKEHNIGRVRNAGAKAATGETFVFIDADTRIPAELLQKICEAITDEKCYGGAVAVGYENFERKWMRYYTEII